jgi:Flp pilus assembly protein TadG
MRNRNRRRGSALIEFSLTGVPLIFIWIGVAQMSIAMWNYHTMQYSAKAAGAYVAVHGHNYCVTTGVSCQIKDTAQIIANKAIGIPQSALTVTFTPLSADASTAGTAIQCTLDQCLTGSHSTDAWPSSGYDTAGSQFKIELKYQFNSAIAMVAPGAGPSQSATSYWFPAMTQQMILF